MHQHDLDFLRDPNYWRRREKPEDATGRDYRLTIHPHPSEKYRGLSSHISGILECLADYAEVRQTELSGNESELSAAWEELIGKFSSFVDDYPRLSKRFEGIPLVIDAGNEYQYLGYNPSLVRTCLVFGEMSVLAVRIESSIERTVFDTYLDFVHSNISLIRDGLILPIPRELILVAGESQEENEYLVKTNGVLGRVDQLAEFESMPSAFGHVMVPALEEHNKYGLVKLREDHPAAMLRFHSALRTLLTEGKVLDGTDRLVAMVKETDAALRDLDRVVRGDRIRYAEKLLSGGAAAGALGAGLVAHAAGASLAAEVGAVLSAVGTHAGLQLWSTLIESRQQLRLNPFYFPWKIAGKTDALRVKP